MVSHKCKLCSRAFTNGRALGGHMKAHLTAPPKPPPSPSSSFSDHDESTLYELREENPKRGDFRFSDPVFNIVLQDRESETESKNPTRKRSKRWRKPEVELEVEPASSVSDASPEEDLAICLMMLSRDRWVESQNQNEGRSWFEELGSKIKVKKGIRRKKKCEKCKKQFRSYRALFSHEKICQSEQEEEEEEEEEEGNRRRIFKCPFCYKLFGSGQALGGHKRSHLVSTTNNSSVSLKLQISLIDLNLPAPLEEDDYSVVSDA
ncbi:hypothetical protein IC582_022202 [Cucumis melo]|uniref:Zinc finger protein ZAT9 n=1 Tax=Cucumis melo TaxID=3656 RepID=A0A1S3ATN8_CUCME|nr:zinc finger protein ZAT9 [Cucumis melo]